MLDLKSLRYFVEVAKYQNVTRAAEALGLAQPAVSMAIKRLEQSTGLILLHRRERRVSLTDEGQRLLIHAHKLLQNVADAELEMDELRGLEQGNVHLGTPSMLGSYYFPPLIMAFGHRFPGLTLSVHEGGAWELQQMLERGELDLAVIESDDLPSTLEAKHLLKEEMRVVVPLDHPFAALKSVTPEQFLRENLVIFRKGYFHRRVLDQMADEAGITPKINFETNLLPLTRAIVKQGFGISTLLRIAVEDDPELTTLPFEPPIKLDLSLAWRKGGYLSKANRAFVDFVLENR